MATTQDLITRALKRLGVVAINADPSAEDAQYGLDAFNEMVDSWVPMGVDVSLDLPLDSKFDRAIVALLAVRLSDDYGVDLKPSIVKDARDGWVALQAAYIFPPDPTDFDAGLKVLPSTGISGVDIINNA